jgi:hypothetical protein
MRFVVALSALLALPLGAPAAAQQLLASYAAHIGPEDLRNSQGDRLREPWQVLRQDRANFHRFGIRHRGDEHGPILPRPLRGGRMEPAARNILVQVGAFVFVQVYGRGRQLQRVGVLVSR